MDKNIKHMKKLLSFLKYACIVALGLTLASLVLYLLATKNTEFNFANDGKVICVEHRDWGLFGNGNMNCFGIVPLNSGIDNLIQTVQTLDKNGEIILRK
jgi:hypothetical protein